MRMKDRLIVWAATLIIRFLHRSIRWQYIGSEARPENLQCIISFWHARLLMTPLLVGKWTGPGIVSHHKDGELITRIFMNFGFTAARGSSSKGGARALLKLIRITRDGASPGITPDGPRGPAQLVKNGVAQIAIKSHVPILPVCYATQWHWRLSSWDRFYVPKPFSKGVVVIGEPLYAQDGESIEAFKQRIQCVMDDTQKQADTFFALSKQ
ncbi:MAG: lysophospholipid acyltransferase family protein [Ghiorsea sp.]|nr:lysophospholipid acyltransferase family protein [Ghiorsea sp.]